MGVSFEARGGKLDCNKDGAEVDIVSITNQDLTKDTETAVI